MPAGAAFLSPATLGSVSMYSTNFVALLAPSGPKYTCQPPLCSKSRSSNIRKISRDGW